jgi:hypothetical protein
MRGNKRDKFQNVFVRKIRIFNYLFIWLLPSTVIGLIDSNGVLYYYYYYYVCRGMKHRSWPILWFYHRKYLNRATTYLG